MNILLKTGAAALMAITTFAASTETADAQQRYVKVINRTSVVLYSWRSSSVQSNKWGPDRLVSRQIPPRASATFDLSRAAGGCYFDFRAEFLDGEVVESRNRNVCGGYELTYTD